MTCRCPDQHTIVWYSILWQRHWYLGLFCNALLMVMMNSAIVDWSSFHLCQRYLLTFVSGTLIHVGTKALPLCSIIVITERSTPMSIHNSTCVFLSAFLLCLVYVKVQTYCCVCLCWPFFYISEVSLSLFWAPLLIHLGFFLWSLLAKSQFTPLDGIGGCPSVFRFRINCHFYLVQ